MEGNNMKAGLLIITAMIVTLITACTSNPTSPTSAAPPSNIKDTDLSLKFISQTMTARGGDRLDASIQFEFTNISGKDIKAIKGRVYAYDQWGECLGSSMELEIAPAPFSAGGTIKDEGHFQNPSERFQHLLEKYPTSVIFKWETSKVRYQ